MINDIKQKRRYYFLGKKIYNDSFFKEGKRKTKLEGVKQPFKYDIINYIIETLNRETSYLEIGVRNPNSNFNKIKASKKYGVDPGLEYSDNTIDFKLTSDGFFNKLRKDEVLNKNIKFDVILIDGLHLADQVENDINNSLEFIKDDGYIVLHDCNPPTQFHAREYYEYEQSPANRFWNGTTWKAFFKARQNDRLYSCCIDTDWGIGVISKTKKIGNKTEIKNPFFEYKILDKYRKESLNLCDFEEFKKKFI